MFKKIVLSQKGRPIRLARSFLETHSLGLFIHVLMHNVIHINFLKSQQYGLNMVISFDLLKKANQIVVGINY